MKHKAVMVVAALFSAGTGSLIGAALGAAVAVVAAGGVTGRAG